MDRVTDRLQQSDLQRAVILAWGALLSVRQSVIRAEMRAIYLAGKIPMNQRAHVAINLNLDDGLKTEHKVQDLAAAGSNIVLVDSTNH